MLVEFELHLPKEQNIVWIPKEIVNALGRQLKLVPNSESAVIYASGADLRRVVKSLYIIIAELELRSSKKEISIKGRAQVTATAE